MIYLKGQTNIRKAIVKITFTNYDKTKSPAGYEASDEIVLERIISIHSNKYKILVNGRNKKQSEVKGIFKQVRLNVDNPSTFFVQQGKVAEIVKFNPKKLMSFLEESAGVSYFNTVRKETLANLKRKEPIMESNLESIE